MVVESGNSPIQVLMIDDNKGDYVLVRAMLADLENSHVALDWVESYAAGLPLMLEKRHDVYLVDYHLDQRNGLDLIREATQAGCTAPMILLTGLDNEEFGMQAVKAGAADYLVKNEISGRLLERSMRYALERKHTEERLRLLESVVVHANDAILITEAEPIDLPGPRILYANQSFCRETGYTEEEIIGQTPRILQGPKTDRATLDKIRTALSKWQPIEVELVNYRKDGTEFWVELSIVPVADATGWFTHWISVQRDVTARRQVQEDLRLAKEEAEQASRAKSEFLSRMSHELRTPMNAVLGFSQLLQMDELTPEQQDSIGQIIKAGQHLLDLINEVLDIARIESGRLALSSEPISVREVVHEAINLLRPLANGLNVQFDTHSIDQCEQYVLADLQRFKQVILNLLSNAIKYNREGGQVHFNCVAPAHDRLRIAISDTGQGIAPDKMQRLFIPFDRLDADESGIEGTGIGLVLSKRLIEFMGGSLAATSTVGQGSTFTVELPLANNPIKSLEAIAPGANLPLDAQVLQKHTILYVEDNIPNLNLLERILTRRPQVHLVSAMQGRFGVELAQQHQPDLILLDLHLPDINGDEVLRLLRADPVTRTIPVIMISADATPGQIQRLRDAGADDYITKPLDVKQFLGVIDTYLKAKS